MELTHGAKGTPPPRFIPFRLCYGSLCAAPRTPEQPEDPAPLVDSIVVDPVAVDIQGTEDNDVVHGGDSGYWATPPSSAADLSAEDDFFDSDGSIGSDHAFQSFTETGAHVNDDVDDEGEEAWLATPTTTRRRRRGRRKSTEELAALEAKREERIRERERAREEEAKKAEDEREAAAATRREKAKRKDERDLEHIRQILTDQGIGVVKYHGGARGGQASRILFTAPPYTHIYWQKPSARGLVPGASSSIELEGSMIKSGIHTTVLRRANSPALERTALSIIHRDRTLDVELPSRNERDALLRGLTLMVEAIRSS